MTSRNQTLADVIIFNLHENLGIGTDAWAFLSELQEEHDLNFFFCCLWVLYSNPEEDAAEISFIKTLCQICLLKTTQACTCTSLYKIAKHTPKWT